MVLESDTPAWTTNFDAQNSFLVQNILSSMHSDEYWLTKFTIVC